MWVISSEMLEYDEMRASLSAGCVGRGGEVGVWRVRMRMDSGVVGEEGGEDGACDLAGAEDGEAGECGWGHGRVVGSRWS